MRELKLLGAKFASPLFSAFYFPFWSVSIKSNEAKWNARRIGKHVADLSVLFRRFEAQQLRITIFIAVWKSAVISQMQLILGYTRCCVNDSRKWRNKPLRLLEPWESYYFVDVSTGTFDFQRRVLFDDASRKKSGRQCFKHRKFFVAGKPGIS